MALFKSLSHRPFALLWSGQTISRLGDALYRISLSWWILEKTGSATTMGTVLFFSLVPMLIFLPIGGVIVDRLPRLKLMLISDLLRGLVVLAVAALSIYGVMQVWHIYIAAIIFGLVDAFFQPAYTATVPQITPRDYLPSANSLTSLSGQVTNIVGPALGAVIFATGGAGVSFALDGISFLISAGCLLGAMSVTRNISFLPARSLGQDWMRGIWNELKDGMQTVLGSSWLWITITIAALLNVTLFGPLAVAMPFLVKKVLNSGVDILGWISSFNAAGAVLAAVTLGRMKRLPHRGWLGYAGLLGSGVAVGLFGLLPGFPAVLLYAFLFGVTITVFGLVWTNLLQEYVPIEKLGRVSSIDSLGSYILLPLGYAASGWLTDKVGPAQVFLTGGVLSILLVAIGLLMKDIRRLE